MSTHAHHGRVVPICQDCGHDADTVIVAAGNADGPRPYCFPCANMVVEHHGGREYPIEAFYTPEGHHCSEFDPDREPVFDLFDPDNSNRAWVASDNCAADLEAWA